jgi:hypothetical protein
MQGRRPFEHMPLEHDMEGDCHEKQQAVLRTGSPAELRPLSMMLGLLRLGAILRAWSTKP